MKTQRNQSWILNYAATRINSRGRYQGKQIHEHSVYFPLHFYTNVRDPHSHRTVYLEYPPMCAVYFCLLLRRLVGGGRLCAFWRPIALRCRNRGLPRRRRLHHGFTFLSAGVTQAHAVRVGRRGRAAARLGILPSRRHSRTKRPPSLETTKR